MRLWPIAGAAALAWYASAAAAAQPITNWAPGDWVLARWQGGAEWYPGVIQSRSGDNATIRYDDGSVDTRPISQLRPFEWAAGTRVTCQFRDGNWYEARIVQMNEDYVRMQIRWDDGTTEQTNTGRCRQDR